jgi:ribosome-associated protein
MFTIGASEIKYVFIRSPGPGGQNVNKVATGVQLSFNINKTRSLPEDVRTRLLLLAANKLNAKGEIIIKATRFRSQERNKQDALERLNELIKRASIIPKKRKKTKPNKAAVERRLVKKKLNSKTKSLRAKFKHDGR